MGQILSLISTSISTCLAWFNQLDNALKFSSFLLSAFLLYTVVRILIRPLIGSGSSDLVKRVKSKNTSNNKNTSNKKG